MRSITHERNATFDVGWGWQMIVQGPPFWFLDVRQEIFDGFTPRLEVGEHGFGRDWLGPICFVLKSGKLGASSLCRDAFDGNYIHQTAFLNGIHHCIRVRAAKEDSFAYVYCTA
jgi:hypothetical protein